MEPPALDPDYLKQWIGRRERSEDVVTPQPPARLSATLDRDDPVPQPDEILPALWHWLYFLPCHKQSELGPDGHAKLGGFLPTLPLPRRMWAGGRLCFHCHFRIGEAIERVSTVKDIAIKEGRSGPLCFVAVEHRMEGDRDS
jgi:3-methylfumaryl-CoA hydratase